MSMATNISRKLLMQPISGRLALMSAVVAVGLPTMLRLSLDGFVTGLAVAPYIPFIFLCAVLLVWWHAALVALVSAAVSDLLFVGPPNQMLEGPTDLLVIGLFLIVSAMAIGFVSAIRGLASQYRRPIHADRSLRGIIFSLEDNHAWASWDGESFAVRLGPQAEVAEMMRDFLAQLEVGERLNRHR